MCGWTSAQNASQRKGLEEGLNKGMVKDKLEVAKKALAKGLSVEMIHDITGLDIETIRKYE